MSWEVVSCWIENHPGLSSWVQAVGSILAILVAVRVASSQRREQLKNEQRKFDRDCEILKVVARQAVWATKPSPSEISARDAARELLRMSSVFNNIDLMGLPDASLIEPVSTIRETLRAIELAISNEPSVEQYFESQEHSKWSKAICLARNSMLEEIARVS